ncbi:hypothetical protein LCGC14_1814970, partial [marine sediment metagenome]
VTVVPPALASVLGVSDPTVAPSGRVILTPTSVSVVWSVVTPVVLRISEAGTVDVLTVQVTYSGLEKVEVLYDPLQLVVVDSGPRQTVNVKIGV